ncbi:hypothetical protein KY285_036284 [Solanum tuberosum]|nr:hypothetical protein KY285_036284 [Solanum tuberosum]
MRRSRILGRLASDQREYITVSLRSADDVLNNRSFGNILPTCTSQAEEKVVVKRLCARDVYGNPKFLWLPKKHVEENLLKPPFPIEINMCSKSIEIIPVLVKNLCAKDVAENPNCLRLSKEESRLLVPHVLLQVGHAIFLPLNDTITKESIVVLVEHPVQDKYYITGSNWEEYVAKHKLLVIEDTTIFVNKVILDPTAKVQLVNTSYHY